MKVGIQCSVLGIVGGPSNKYLGLISNFGIYSYACKYCCQKLLSVDTVTGLFPLSRKLVFGKDKNMWRKGISFTVKIHRNGGNVYR